ncbi:aminotransferase DegT [Siccirubricoccus deserti]|uniref:DegT/DnrJ/EryC1/StrS aminotransferase family protein n=1 Tax=Siccirubricoccus deserti TaxID=2013562 RepID=A0A9X0QUA5_9PROT|nr:DegT/DnrJ/EryC1/StrS aminotransferase family protein [Siccirubricoccus deserti]MBC4013859.1 DegT/DnrJ/EryC1/StrS aminotransferase family protein [Siccirubricoccus deserti]GGC30081.1 aminotransferase DegT [Siccirubricoccus deserti]
MTEPRPIAFFDMKAQQALIRAEIDAGIARILDHGRFIQGPEVDALEAKLAGFCGAGHAVGVSSGTDAIQIALMAEGIGPGDAVFLPAFTYTATAEVPLVLGATPVFVDVDPATFNLDLADLERRVALVLQEGRLRPRAVIGVDLYGLPADWPAIRALCDRHGMFALDDAAQAFGGALHGKRLGAWAHATACSFYPTKTLGCYGDGGAIITDDPARAELYRSLRTHGEGKSRYEVLRTGMNGRLDSIQAAILLAKLPLLEGELKSRTQAAAWYEAALGGRVTTPQGFAGAESAWGIYTILLPDAEARARVQAAMQAAGVPSAIYYPKPLHRQPAYAEAHARGIGAPPLNGPPPLPVSEALCERCLSLPMHPYLTEADVARVADAVLAKL